MQEKKGDPCMKSSPILFTAILSFLALNSAHAQTSDSKFPVFDTAKAAQHRCPFDFVVWVDTKSDTYAMGGPPAGVDLKNGAYMCQRDADQMDYQLMQGPH